MGNTTAGWDMFLTYHVKDSQGQQVDISDVSEPDVSESIWPNKMRLSPYSRSQGPLMA